MADKLRDSAEEILQVLEAEGEVQAIILIGLGQRSLLQRTCVVPGTHKRDLLTLLGMLQLTSKSLSEYLDVVEDQDDEEDEDEGVEAAN